jgi:hypothetical protein
MRGKLKIKNVKCEKEWKNVKDFFQYYHVRSDGKVRESSTWVKTMGKCMSFHTEVRPGKLVLAHRDADGRKFVILHHKAADFCRKVYIDQLVASTFGRRPAVQNSEFSSQIVSKRKLLNSEG